MKINLSSLIILIFSTLFFSCSDSNDSPNEFGRLSVQLTDAPFPHDLVAEANVTIFKIDARYKGDVELDDSDLDDNGMIEDDNNDDEGAFITLMENEVQVNLLDLTNGITENLLNAEVPVGSYDLVRVYVKGVNVILTDGTTYDLKVPSGEQSGIKVFIAPELVVRGGLTADLLLDFDVSRSFVAKGGTADLASITGFNFKPVIKASNLSTAGTLSGTVTEIVEEGSVGVEGVQVSVFEGDTQITSTFTDVDGGYMIMGLEAGSYRVEMEKEGYVLQTFSDIEIIAANRTELDVEIEVMLP